MKKISSIRSDIFFDMVRPEEMMPNAKRTPYPVTERIRSSRVARHTIWHRKGNQFFTGGKQWQPVSGQVLLPIETHNTRFPSTNLTNYQSINPAGIIIDVLRGGGTKLLHHWHARQLFHKGGGGGLSL